MSKIPRKTTLEELVECYVPSGTTIGLGGLHFHNTPMALIRELIRQDIHIQLLIPPLDGSINADQLIGASLVEEIQIAYLGVEFFGLAGRFRAAAESGEIRVHDCEEAGFAMALMAGAAGQPFAALPFNFLPVPSSIPSILSVNRKDYAFIENPFTGEKHAVVRAINPAVSLIHCQLIDRRGNCGFLGAPFLDVEMAKAGSVCLVQAEEEVYELPSDCLAYLPSYVVDAYCVLKGGAHPASSHGLYNYDKNHISNYVKASHSDFGFANYCRDMIGESESAYRNNAAVISRITQLAVKRP